MERPSSGLVVSSIRSTDPFRVHSPSKVSGQIVTTGRLKNETLYNEESVSKRMVLNSHLESMLAVFGDTKKRERERKLFDTGGGNFLKMKSYIF